VESVHQPRGLLVQNFEDLVSDLCELLSFRPDELPPPVRAASLVIYLRVQLGLQRILVAAKRAQVPPIGNQRFFTVVGSRKVNFAKVYACYLITFRLGLRFDLELRPKLVLLAVPADLNAPRLRPLPASGSR
jgi:hypothetical protein